MNHFARLVYRPIPDNRPQPAVLETPRMRCVQGLFKGKALHRSVA
jgi:hypothetical protein